MINSATLIIHLDSDLVRQGEWRLHARPGGGGRKNWEELLSQTG